MASFGGFHKVGPRLSSTMKSTKGDTYDIGDLLLNLTDLKLNEEAEKCVTELCEEVKDSIVRLGLEKRSMIVSVRDYEEEFKLTNKGGWEVFADTDSWELLVLDKIGQNVMNKFRGRDLYSLVYYYEGGLSDRGLIIHQLKFKLKIHANKFLKTDLSDDPFGGHITKKSF